MIVARSLDELTRDQSSVVTVGTFDGVHRGHREIIREVVARARNAAGRSVAITFDPHPKEVVTSPKGPVSLLTTVAERIMLLEVLGLDLLYIVRFTYAFSRLSSHEFYRRYVVHGTGVREVVVGFDHSFGRDREAGIDQLVHLGQEFGFSISKVQQYTVDGEPVSSTKIRHALLAGEAEKAARMLGYPYALEGIVVKGDGRGKTLGFPTANIAPVARNKVIPARGVYLAGARVGDRRYYGMLNIGVRPTVTDGVEQTIEVHLFDFAGSIYGEKLTLSFLRRLRGEMKFPSPDALSEQLARDREAARRFVGQFEEEAKRTP